MREKEKSPKGGDWVCGKCGEALVSASVRVRYMGATLSLDLLKCPRCGTAMVTEEVATGRMAEAEQVLEDK
ncbi:MAG: DVU_1557 family redox protein [Syntrophorhabdales bacterium]